MSREVVIVWTQQNTLVLVELVLHEVRTGHRGGTKLDNEGRERVIRLFNERHVSNVPLTVSKFSDKWTHAKNCSQFLQRWLLKETGLGYDRLTLQVTVADHFWEKHLKASNKATEKAIRSLRNGSFYHSEMWGGIFGDLISNSLELRNSYGPAPAPVNAPVHRLVDVPVRIEVREASD